MSQVERPSGRAHALVTGASSGIGRVFAERLAGLSYDLTIVARDSVRLEALAEELRREKKVEVRVHPADLTDPAALGRVEDLAAVGIDLLVNNAGFGTLGPFAELDPDGEERQIRLNVLALSRLTRAALPKMIERRSGAILNVSSMAALTPGPFMATYCATKAFVVSFSESLAEELRGTGVRVQALLPGFTRTEFQARSGLDPAAIPAPAWMSAEEVVDSSLAALERGTVVHVPGLKNRAMVRFTQVTPRRITRRAAGLMMKRTLSRGKR